MMSVIINMLSEDDFYTQNSLTEYRQKRWLKIRPIY